MLKVKAFIFNPFQEISYLVINPRSNEAALIDPGMANSAEQRALDNYISQNGIKLTQLINTHLHVDHCFGNSYVNNRYGLSVSAHPDDAFLGERVAVQTRTFGVLPEGGEPKAVEIDIELHEGDSVKIGDDSLKVLHVPGHSPGSIALYSPSSGFVITGDALFRGSIGRTDLPGGNHAQLLGSIREKLLALPDDTIVYPGHGPASTIGEEKRTNPFIIGY